ncbi:MAG: hypothetical protein K2P09_03925 [Erysipelotrichales bacterium]|nr:hypothetical protein [Erysipelotrichales bacterium]
MFKKFFAKEEEDEVFETVDPVLEQRRKEKFSTPLIYNDEVEEEKKVEIKKEPVKKTAPVTESTYRMSEIISPISGVTKKAEPEIKIQKPKKKKIKKDNDSLIPIISPFYGPTDHKEVKEDTKEKKVVIEKEQTVEDKLRDIASIVKEEQDQLKIIEERTGEFKLDFNNETENSFIDEIDDSMSLDELMSLYEKKFKD